MLASSTYNLTYTKMYSSIELSEYNLTCFNSHPTRSLLEVYLKYAIRGVYYECKSIYLTDF